jgi:hypothetical protein
VEAPGATELPSVLSFAGGWAAREETGAGRYAAPTEAGAGAPDRRVTEAA